jgi:DNA-directed RNA polymerase specialized sigma24 family protein
MWIPPWAHSSLALGAFGAPATERASAEDRAIADLTAAAVRENLRAGRPFYDPVPKEFAAKFQQAARGIYNYLLAHPEYMIKGMTPEEQKELATKVVNKTYYNALRGITGYRGDAAMKGWFYVIARNALIDELRMWIRSPEGQARRAQHALDATSETGAAEALQKAASEAMTSGDFSLSDDSFRRLVVLVAQAQRIGHDVNGREFISKEDGMILRAYIKARGKRDVLASYLRMREDEAERALDAVTERVSEWAPRLRKALAARGE